MIPEPRPKRRLVSVTLAKESIKEQAEHVIDLERNLEKAKIIRDNLIKDALDNKIPYADVAIASQLTVSYLRKLKQLPRLDPNTGLPMYSSRGD